MSVILLCSESHAVAAQLCTERKAAPNVCAVFQYHQSGVDVAEKIGVCGRMRFMTEKPQQNNKSEKSTEDFRKMRLRA
jgi:hypothetical protein